MPLAGTITVMQFPHAHEFPVPRVMPPQDKKIQIVRKAFFVIAGLVSFGGAIRIGQILMSDNPMNGELIIFSVQIGSFIAILRENSYI